MQRLTWSRTSSLLGEHGWAAWQHGQTCCTQHQWSQLRAVSEVLGKKSHIKTQ